MSKEPCMCGAVDCPVCGRLQGTYQPPPEEDFFDRVDREYDEFRDMNVSGLASAGFGTDEDYGDYGDWFDE